jgi:hypothetical protein
MKPCNGNCEQGRRCTCWDSNTAWYAMGAVCALLILWAFFSNT